MSGRSEEDDLVAAEYVLGTLPLEDRAAAELRLRREPGFAAAVEDWELRLSGLNAEFDEAPAPDLLPRLEAQLFPVPAAPTRAGWGAWAAAALSSLALVAWLWISPLPPDFTARIVDAGGTLEYDASLRGETLQLTRVQGEAPPPDRAHELWLIVGEAAPVSLGLLSADTRLHLAALPVGATLAVSLEPAGGSPTGQPTGPVIAVGQLAAS